MYSFIKNMPKRINPPPPPPEKEFESKTISLFSQPYLDTYNQCYKNIVVVNMLPKGPLAKIVRFIKFPPLSEFNRDAKCGYALINCKNELMIVDEIPDLISYLVSNNYSIDTSITKMFNTSDIRFDNKLICFITYNGI